MQNIHMNMNNLVLEKKNGYYFLIYFELSNFRSNWRFGFPFFKKYHFVFNHDSKLMGFKYPDGCSESNNNNAYIKNNNIYEIKNEKINNNTNDIFKNNNKELINEEENRKFGFKIVIIMFFGIIFIVAVILFFGIFIGKKMFGMRKNKVNELLELYDYSSADKKKEAKKESSKDK